MVNRQRVSELLQGHGIIPTQQRVEIALLMLEGNQHLSADQVLARVNQGGTAVSKATVYNTLGLFADRGIIRQVIVDPTKVFYDSNATPHYHFYNVDEGTLIDFDASDLPISNTPLPPAGTIAESIEVIVRIRNKPTLPYPR
ncbi:MAG TPA: Fur family transcriptional regulator [Gammaproteobacteria bacterium]|nr:Fur family transcriptional regulator [Gammaproteobacteria bacterium]